MGDNQINLDTSEITLSSRVLGFSVLIRLMLSLPRVLYIIFFIDYNTDDWYHVCYRCLMQHNVYVSIDFGRLLLRVEYVPLMQINRAHLKTIKFHYIKADYQLWLPEFFSSMQICEICVDNLTLLTENGLEESAFFLPEYSFISIIIRGRISDHLLNHQSPELQAMKLYTSIYHPSLFSATTISSVCNLRLLSVLCISYCNIGDAELFKICSSLTCLQCLDISGCVLLSSNGLKNLRLLPRLSSLSVAYVDVSYESLQMLPLLCYLDVSYLDFAHLYLLVLMSHLPRLETVICVGPNPDNLQHLDEILQRQYLFLDRNNAPPINIYCDNRLLTLFRTYHYYQYRIYAHPAFTSYVPESIQRSVSYHITRSLFFRRSNNRWVRDFLTEISIEPVEGPIIEEL